MHRLTIVDVFTDRLFLGNPVAVVHDADDLTDDDLAAFARWTNLSETTFLLAPTHPDADYRLRIFTPVRELPFAGHPTLGSARAWLDAGGVPRTPDELTQECGAGLVGLRRIDGRWAFAAPPLLRDEPLGRAEVAALADWLEIDTTDVVAARWADNGPGWVAVLLNSADAVLALAPRLGVPGPFPAVGVVGPYPPGGETAVEVRAFVVEDDIGEDPVTGSLHAALGQWLIPGGRLPARYVAAQGRRRGRDGRVHVSALEGVVWVAGDTVVGVSGALRR